VYAVANADLYYRLTSSNSLDILDFIRVVRLISFTGDS